MTDVKSGAQHDIYTEEVGDSSSSRRFSLSSILSSRRPLVTKDKTYKYFLPKTDELAAASPSDTILVPVHEDHLPRRKGYDVLSRFNDRMQPGLGPNEEYRLLRMSKSEYEKYWARTETGGYIGTEPEGEGQRRLRAQNW